MMEKGTLPVEYKGKSINEMDIDIDYPEENEPKESSSPNAPTQDNEILFVWKKENIEANKDNNIFDQPIPENIKKNEDQETADIGGPIIPVADMAHQTVTFLECNCFSCFSLGCRGSKSDSFVC
ncbi:uncharacterized protein LOC132695986 [Cylas formicarius]|uniref:uncharacterized protein LOC132695986 n=1 Tax=Cylas formicarius TaxID=197179 RepID=UPI002958DBCE|nr:uncharacterized protein LOC132695986 [Cylas formicarius]